MALADFKVHAFVSKTFSKPTDCGFCKQFIWGLRKQGFACKGCQYPLCKKCKKTQIPNIPLDCGSGNYHKRGAGTTNTSRQDGVSNGPSWTEVAPLAVKTGDLRLAGKKKLNAPRLVHVCLPDVESFDCLFYFKSKTGPPCSIPLVSASASVDSSAPGRFELRTPKRTYCFQADTEEERNAWMVAIRDCTGSVLASPTGLRQSTNSAATAEAIRELRQISGNDLCADCRAPNPEWISLNLAIFICIECSGAHRHLGVHLSQVRSATLDSLEPEDIQLLRCGGNASLNEFFTALLPEKIPQPDSTTSKELREMFIGIKYSEANVRAYEQKLTLALEEMGDDEPAGDTNDSEDVYSNTTNSFALQAADMSSDSPTQMGTLLYEFIADNEGELSCDHGERVIIESASGGWCLCRREGSSESGYVPENYIELEAQSTNPTTSLANLSQLSSQAQVEEQSNGRDQPATADSGYNESAATHISEDNWRAQATEATVDEAWAEGEATGADEAWAEGEGAYDEGAADEAWDEGEGAYDDEGAEESWQAGEAGYDEGDQAEWNEGEAWDEGEAAAYEEQGSVRAAWNEGASEDSWGTGAAEAEEAPTEVVAPEERAAHSGGWNREKAPAPQPPVSASNSLLVPSVRARAHSAAVAPPLSPRRSVPTPTPSSNSSFQRSGPPPLSPRRSRPPPVGAPETVETKPSERRPSHLAAPPVRSQRRSMPPMQPVRPTSFQVTPVATPPSVRPVTSFQAPSARSKFEQAGVPPRSATPPVRTASPVDASVGRSATPPSQTTSSSVMGRGIALNIPVRDGAPVVSRGGAPFARGGAPASRGGVPPASRGGQPTSRGGAPAACRGAPAARRGAPASRGGQPASRGGAPASCGTRGAPSLRGRGGPPSSRGGPPSSRGANTFGASSSRGAASSRGPNTFGAPSPRAFGPPSSRGANTFGAPPSRGGVPPRRPANAAPFRGGAAPKGGGLGGLNELLARDATNRSTSSFGGASSSRGNFSSRPSAGGSRGGPPRGALVLPPPSSRGRC